MIRCCHPGVTPPQLVSSPSQGTFTQGQRTFWQWDRNRISTQVRRLSWFSGSRVVLLEWISKLCPRYSGSGGLGWGWGVGRGYALITGFQGVSEAART